MEVSLPNFPHFILSVKLLPSVNLFCFSLKVSSQTVQRYCISVRSVKRNSRLDLSLCILPLSRFCLFDQKQTHSSRNILSGHQSQSQYTLNKDIGPHLFPILPLTLSIDLIRVLSPINSHLTYQIWNWIPISGQYL